MKFNLIVLILITTLFVVSCSNDEGNSADTISEINSDDLLKIENDFVESSELLAPNSTILDYDQLINDLEESRSHFSDSKEANFNYDNITLVNINKYRALKAMYKETGMSNDDIVTRLYDIQMAAIQKNVNVPLNKSNSGKTIMIDTPCHTPTAIIFLQSCSSNPGNALYCGSSGFYEAEAINTCCGTISSYSGENLNPGVIAYASGWIDSGSCGNAYTRAEVAY